jgi:hypothetical protein
MEMFGTSAKIEDRALKLFDPARRPSLAGFLPLTDDRFHAVGSRIGADFKAAQRRFLRTFPDFDCREYVAFGPSLFTFDGHGFEDHDHKIRMLFGVDMIAMLHPPGDLPAFFDHELFHIYHDQVTPRPAPSLSLAWWALWREGLATYVSQRMNPRKTPQDVLWFPTDLVTRMRPQLGHAAALLLDDIDKDDEQTYAMWFAVPQSPAGLPPRAGYYLGYLFAAELGKTRSLGTLAKMAPADIHARAKLFLGRLADGK